VLTGAADRAIRLWNPLTAAQHYAPNTTVQKEARPPGLIQTYTAGHAHPVTCIAVSRGNDKFVSGGGDKHVLLWDVTAGHVIRRWEGHSRGQINAVVFAGDAREDNLVVSGGFDSTIRVWDIRQGGNSSGSGSKAAMLMVMSEARDAITSIACAKESTCIWAGSVDGRVRNYDFRMGRVTVDVLGHPVTSLSTTRRADGILVGTLDSTLRLLDSNTGKLLQAFKGSDEHMFANQNFRLKSTLAINDGVVLSGTEDGRVLGWDVISGQVKWDVEHDNRPKDADKRAVVGAVAECPSRDEWCSAGGNGMTPSSRLDFGGSC
jgi:mitogen-activated protein kinase organizer 1